jgi:hypothetical protein
MLTIPCVPVAASLYNPSSLKNASPGVTQLFSYGCF